MSRFQAMTERMAHRRPSSDAPKRPMAMWSVALAATLMAGTGPATMLAASPTPTSADPGPVIAYQWVRGDGGSVYYMDPDGSGSRDAFPAVEGSLLHPDWSPDGSRIAFGLETSTGMDIWVADANGSDATLMVDHACADACVEADQPAWSPDGRSIAFKHARADETGLLGMTIEVVDVATGDTRVVVTSDPDTALEYPRWCEGGTSIVYQVSTLPTDPSAPDGPGTATGSYIAIVDATTPGARPQALTDPSMYAGYPDCRSTDDLLVFTTYDFSEFGGTQDPSELYTMRPDGTEITRLTDTGRSQQRAGQPTWTPDGERILFTLAGWDSPGHAAFVDEHGDGLQVLSPRATHPRLRPGR